MAKSLLYCLIPSILMVLLACETSDDATPEPYKWVPSPLSTTGALNLTYLKIGPDDQLYALGMEGDKSIFAKLVNNSWEILARVKEPVISDFSIFRDTIYYGSQTGIKKTIGTFVESVLTTATFCYLESYHNKLIITGSPVYYNGEEYTILSYDENGIFQSIDQGVYSSSMKKVNDKLFISGDPMKIYDGTELLPTEYHGGFLYIDAEESFYSWVSAYTLTVINKMVDGKYETVGNTIQTKAAIDRMEFVDNTIFVCGHNYDTLPSSVFFLSKKNEWQPITTTFPIYFLLNFQGTILATTDGGQIMELRPN